jgi:hypothetical protein
MTRPSPRTLSVGIAVNRVSYGTNPPVVSIRTTRKAPRGYGIASSAPGATTLQALRSRASSRLK